MRRTRRAAADLRLLRATVFAAVCVLLSAAGHEAAGGGVPRTGALIAGGLTVLACTVPMAGRKRSVPGIPIALLASQLGLHTLYCLTPAPAGGAGRPSQDLLTLAGHLRCGGVGRPLTLTDAAALVQRAGLRPVGAHPFSGMPRARGTHPMAGMPMGSPFSESALLHLVPSPAMLAAHLVAATIVGLLLWRGELALWILTAHPAKRVLPWPLTRVPGILRLCAEMAGSVDDARRRARATAARRTDRRRTAPDLRQPVVRRGPPSAVTAV